MNLKVAIYKDIHLNSHNLSNFLNNIYLLITFEINFGLMKFIDNNENIQKVQKMGPSQAFTYWRLCG